MVEVAKPADLAARGGAWFRPTSRDVQVGDTAVDWTIRSVLRGHSVMSGLNESGGHDDGEMPVVIQVVLYYASGEPSPAVAAAVARHEATMTPQFPGTDDPTLAVYWQVTAPAAEAAELQAELLDLPEVDGAYVKPPEEPA